MPQQWTLPDTSNRPLAVLGAGVLGRRIAASWLAAGYHVNLRDPAESQRNAAAVFIQTNLSDFEELTGGNRKPGTLNVFSDLGPAVQDAWFVLEAVPEKLEMKIDVMGQLDNLVKPDCIIGSNSSSFKSSKMLEKVKPENRARICNVHYQMPPKANTVEIMTDGQTHPDIIQFMYERLLNAGMLPAIARKESTGLILNRLWAAIKREVLMMLAEGVSDPKEIDALFVRMFGNNSSGPCGMMDAVGLDTVAFIEDNYIEERHLDSALTVDWLRKNFVDQGKLGAKSGKGGLYPPGGTTKSSATESGHHDNLAAPMLYFLDLGVGANFEPSKAFTGGKIMTASSDGSNMKTLIDGVTSPDGIDVSISAGRIFWTSMGIPSKPDGSVLSAKLDGSDIKTIIPKGAVNTAKQLVIDHDNSTIYFYQTKWCVGITVDSKHGKIYWSQKGASKAGQGRIFRAGINIPSGETPSKRSDVEFLFDHLPEPIDLEIDALSQTLYWTDRGEYPLGNTLSKAIVGPGEDKKVITLARHFHEAIGMKIDFVNHHIYVADLGGALYRFNEDGSDKRRIIDLDNCFTGIALAYLH
ncbi:NAD(P)-binding protein [Mollisia scopiformis]|uniref:NAD(P)-binding protein n=1 Tax=Mollisia scopiformis TaxID=149040 RepID=A0A194XLQ8_MOLSC|nr:NAD(P)-binding protein [Mollisia scopiformis]KUJ20702.1 NAD(P)-binding protein [Mollisia scopiformis]